MTVTIRFFGQSSPINGPSSVWNYSRVFFSEEEAQETVQDYLCEHDEGIARYEVDRTVYHCRAMGAEVTCCLLRKIPAGENVAERAAHVTCPGCLEFMESR